jgi:hypothetical protein
MIEKEKDIQLLKAIARTGFTTEEFFPLLDMNDKRIRQHIQCGNLIKKGPHLVYGIMRNIYVLSEEAKRRCRSEFLIRTYKSDISQLEHDYVLTKIYTSLKFEQKQSWKTETELANIYKDSAKTTDGMYISAEGLTIGVEVITSSYSQKDIDDKLQFVEKYCDTSMVIHAQKLEKY